VPSDRVALVTGASRGLGAAIAQRLARDGLCVALNYHRGADRAEALAARLRDEGAAAEAFGADVTTADGVRALVEAVAERLGEIDVLVLNATGPQPERALEDTRWEHHAAHLDFFLKSPVKPIDVAEAVRFLASPEAGFLTGQLLYVDGGRVLG
jgi:3-oxoacyl-[acyl-carrier protein] reductase